MALKILKIKTSCLHSLQYDFKYPQFRDIEVVVYIIVKWIASLSHETKLYVQLGTVASKLMELIHIIAIFIIYITLCRWRHFLRL